MIRRVPTPALLTGGGIAMILAGTALLVGGHGQHPRAGSVAVAVSSDVATPTPVPNATVQVVMTDQLRFRPSRIEVGHGTTVALVVTNAGRLRHELVIGDDATQAEHELHMRQMDRSPAMHAMHMDGHPGVVEVPPGETRTLVYTFGGRGNLLFGCHVAGHYDAGMRGSIAIT